MSTLERAIEIATQAHEGQVDKDVKRLKKYLKAYKKLVGEPVYSVYACRQEHPNAFDPWTEEADLELGRILFWP